MAASNSIITEAGIAAALSSEARGASFQVAYFKIGSLGDFSPTPDAVDVYNLVYTGRPSELTYRVLNRSAMVFRITLGTEVGNFNIGNIGLFLSTGEMFALTTYFGGNFKYKDNPPDVIGNVKTIDILIPVIDSTGAVSFNVNTNAPSGIPTVATDTNLPDPDDADFNLYVVQANTQFNGFPTLSYTDGLTWTHSRLSDRTNVLYSEQYTGGALPFIGVNADNSMAIGAGARVENGSVRSIAVGPSSVEGPDNIVMNTGGNLATNRTIARNALVIGNQNRGGNSIDDEFNVVLGGFNNQAQEGSYSAVIGGQDNEINARHSAVIGGSQTFVVTDYTRAFAAGQFQQTGDGQDMETIIRTETMDSNIRQILIGNYQKLQLPSFGSWNFVCQMQAANVGGTPLPGVSIPVTGKTWRIAGLIVKGALDEDTVLLGITKEVIIQGPGTDTWDVLIDADTVDGTLDFRASGMINTHIHWMGFLRIQQMILA